MGDFSLPEMKALGSHISVSIICDSPQKSSTVRKVYKPDLCSKARLCTTSPSRLRRATSPCRRGLGSPRKVNSFARGSPTRGAVERSETERLYEGEPDREPLLDSTSPSRLTPCHLPYRGEALAFRKVFLPSSKFSSPPEAPLLGELSAKQTERLYGGEPDLFHAKRPLHFCSGLFSENQAG